MDGGRDRPLTFHWNITNREWRAQLPSPPATSPRLRHAWESILLEALLAYYGGWPSVSYSRRPEFPLGRTRYHGTDFTFRGRL